MRQVGRSGELERFLAVTVTVTVTATLPRYRQTETVTIARQVSTDLPTYLILLL
jgi:hypothetical protein